jgi:signal transduction histidine kinase
LNDEESEIADFSRGLAVIESRAESLHRFIQSYRVLAQLPPPHRRPVPVTPLMERVILIEQRVPVHLEIGPELTLNADSDQLEQLLINLLANAAEASLANGSAPIAVSWQMEDSSVCIQIRDHGAGLANTANLFVPFYTTKPEGSGIGLALAQQIARAHGGKVTLENCGQGPGAIASIRLPLHG